MGTLPRPLLALLIAAIAFFAAWTFVLKPHSSSSSAPQPAVTTVPQTATPKAPATQAASGHATARPSAAVASSAASRAATAAAARRTAAQKQAQAAAAHQQQSAQARAEQAEAALKADKVLALLFYNPAGADDQAVAKELTAIPSSGNTVVKVAVPVDEISRYTEIVNAVPVQSTPTLVVIDAHHRAQTLTGFADQLEYNQLVAGALAAK